MPQSFHFNPSFADHNDAVDGVLSRIDNVIEQDPAVSDDAMRWAPAAGDSGGPVRGLLIPYQDSEPVRIIDLARNDQGRLLEALEPYLGSPVDAGYGLSTADFVVNDEGSYVDRKYFNRRASAARRALWQAVVDGHYAASDVDRDNARACLAAGSLATPLFGPVVFLGADPRTGEWESAPRHVMDAVLASDRASHERVVAVVFIRPAN